jgi:hypothetical protein
MVRDMRNYYFDLPIIAVIEGDEATSSVLGRELPSSFRVLTGEPAERAYSDLSLETTPFLFVVNHREIVRKAVPRGAEHLLSIVQTPETLASNGRRLELPEVPNVK